MGGGIVIIGADDSTTLSFAPSIVLNDLISNVEPRLQIQYAEANQDHPLGPMNPTLQNLINQVDPRFQIQYAEANQLHSLGPLNSTLNALLNEVEARFKIQFAEANTQHPLSYPAALINDITAPQITVTPTPTALTNTTAKVTWTTNEFATTEFKYGIAPGSYTQTLTEDSFQKLHALTLTGLTAGTEYYYRITSTDRSSNVFQDIERSFTFNPPQQVYLPLIRR
ncbi:MAG TPA: fibronectin type III domain-containing protein [Anaerolineales bacterium]|nr:fibronectin type III domain-containing protein [Anaerolineales bacterium]